MFGHKKLASSGIDEVSFTAVPFLMSYALRHEMMNDIRRLPGVKMVEEVPTEEIAPIIIKITYFGIGFKPSQRFIRGTILPKYEKLMT